MRVAIANPIYDVVFKYMMEDNAVARLLVSSIIGEEVVSLEPKPQERTTNINKFDDDTTSLTVYRLDFSARIKTPDGQKSVIIEMQKASFPSDIKRFRLYLGKQYADDYNCETDEDKKGDSLMIDEDTILTYIKDVIRMGQREERKKAEAKIAKKDKVITKKDKELTKKDKELTK